ncbi:NrfD/PsrC family molybdoenzyme membrane anchor subunit [Salisediminibacterium halotolerans]|uniref:NrfD/PsrC family molybdoenzyme membrane anchor subunit n=1 Tax=Salisediminibacterium halotolerans TaxID=517425 RepID=UPI000EB36C16|nr:NrfD/PsrC family molybdoenzyme membrane anchor subunit [Salisediminibacterium halotolerans]RLJ71647.1 molybdopterin-containing oxidoreductase family membrane subunit [Actinophytocola xinjiangensis]RPE86797.1 molybdopterin-containing oxidoreductase family membrane subunit [Salisediminibacterium halotolerans]TWG32860.1 molybdopterin-containing oxidoreductase family membrane subunit [Salisediminibacterium halotolerans]GEL06952.1 oxidoreductase [Salisediminibacterium halotolerans]
MEVYSGKQQSKMTTEAIVARRYKRWISALIISMIIGGAAIGYRVIEGLSVTNLSSFVPWGAWVALYIFFVGLSAGAFLLSTLIFVFGMEQYEKVGRYALFTALICMVVALTFILLDLGRMDRAFNAMTYWNVLSVLSWEVRFYLIYMVLLSVELWFAMRTDLIRMAKTTGGLKGKLADILRLGSEDLSERSEKKDHRWMKILGMIGIPIAIIGVHGGTGTLFAAVAAQPYWNSPLFPVIFVVSALVSGTALLIAMYAVQRKAANKSVDLQLIKGLTMLMIFFLVIDLGLEFYEFLVAGLSMKPEKIEILSVMFTSSMSWSFWGIQIFLGAVVPIFLVFNRRTRDSVKWLTAASVLVVIGIIGVRFNIVVPTQVVQSMSPLPHAEYAPNWVEWFSALGVVSMGLLLYSIGVKLLPLETTNEEVSSYE